MDAGLRAIVPDFADLDPRHLVLLNVHRRASAQWMLLNYLRGRGLRKLASRFSHSSTKIGCRPRGDCLIPFGLPPGYRAGDIVREDRRLLAIQSLSKVDKYGAAVDLKDGLRLTNQRHWVADEQRVELIGRRLQMVCFIGLKF